MFVSKTLNLMSDVALLPHVNAGSDRFLFFRLSIVSSCAVLGICELSWPVGAGSETASL